MTKTLDDIKQEAVSAFLVEERHNDTQEDRIRRVTIQDTIDYLQAKGFLMVWNTDIDSAPRDGTEILIATELKWDMNNKYIHQQDSRIGNGFYISNSWYVEGRWQNRADQFISKPTAWMNLPTAPKEKE